jgi:hypothetical protein
LEPAELDNDLNHGDRQLCNLGVRRANVETRTVATGDVMPQLVNWEILANPINWVIVALMLAIATFGLRLILKDQEVS